MLTNDRRVKQKQSGNMKLDTITHKSSWSPVRLLLLLHSKPTLARLGYAHLWSLAIVRNPHAVDDLVLSSIFRPFQLRDAISCCPILAPCFLCGGIAANRLRDPLTLHDWALQQRGNAGILGHVLEVI